MATWTEGKRSIIYSTVQRMKNGKGKEKGLRGEAQLFLHSQSKEGKERKALCKCRCLQTTERDLVFERVRSSQVLLENWESLLPQLMERKGRERDRINLPVSVKNLYIR